MSAVTEPIVCRVPDATRRLTTMIGALVLLTAAMDANACAGEFEEEAQRLAQALSTAEKNGDGAGVILHRLAEIGPEASAQSSVLLNYLIDGSEEFPMVDEVIHVFASMGGEGIEPVRKALRHRINADGDTEIDNPIPEAATLEFFYMQPRLVKETLEHELGKQPLRWPAWTRDVELLRYFVLHDIEPDVAFATLSEMALDGTSQYGYESGYAMTDLYSRANQVIPVLRADLDNADPYQRLKALRQLSIADREGTTIVPQLVAALNDREREPGTFGSRVNHEAASLLALRAHQAAPFEHEIIAALERASTDEDDAFVVENLAFVLATIKSKMSLPLLKRLFVEQLEKKLPRKRDRLCVALAGAIARLEPGSASEAFLVEILTDANRSSDASRGQFGGVPTDRELAARALGLLDHPRASSLAAMRTAMDDRTESGRPTSMAKSAAWAIACHDRSDNKCIEVLDGCGEIEPLDKYSPCYRQAPDTIVDVLGSRIEAFLPDLYSRVPMYSARGTMAVEILNAGFDRDSALTVRIVEIAFADLEAADRDEETWSANAINALSVLAPHLQPAVPKIKAYLKSDNHVVRTEAAHLLGQIRSRPEICVPALVDALNDDRVFVRETAAWALGEFGTDAVDAIKALKACNDDEYKSVRRSSLASIAKIASHVTE
ncbi:MAG: HEAT repeat domain-containing protein [Planctomycetaceae bacterium]